MADKSLLEWMEGYITSKKIFTETELETINQIDEDVKYDMKKIISNDDLSAKVMNILLKEDLIIDQNDNNLESKEDNDYELKICRARHTLITYLLGCLLIKELKPFKNILGNNERQSLEIWKLISLYHDIGYYYKDIFNKETDIEEKFKGKYLYTEDNIKNAGSNVLAYSLEEMHGYNLYKKECFSQKCVNEVVKNEIIDHGLYGACVTYKKLLKIMPNKNRENLLVSFTIAQHNIFKSNNFESDKNYLAFGLKRLISTSDFKINFDTLWLLFLSLVDTIECAKKFTKKNNSTKYLQLKTILSKIKLVFDGSKLCVNLEDLKKECENRDKEDSSENESSYFMQQYEEYVANLKSLNHWTIFETQDDTISTKDNGNKEISLYISIIIDEKNNDSK